jgi:hypothetical protein
MGSNFSYPLLETQDAATNARSCGNIYRRALSLKKFILIIVHYSSYSIRKTAHTKSEYEKCIMESREEGLDASPYIAQKWQQAFLLLQMII